MYFLNRLNCGMELYELLFTDQEHAVLKQLRTLFCNRWSTRADIEHDLSGPAELGGILLPTPRSTTPLSTSYSNRTLVMRNKKYFLWRKASSIIRRAFPPQGIFTNFPYLFKVFLTRELNLWRCYSPKVNVSHCNKGMRCAFCCRCLLIAYNSTNVVQCWVFYFKYLTQYQNFHCFPFHIPTS